MKSVTPGQQVVKIVHEELTELMGSGGSKLAFAGRPPTVILLAGLQGSGKTTVAAKLALLLRKQGKAPALVAADLQRPAAIDQLEQLGKQIQIPGLPRRGDDGRGRRRAATGSSRRRRRGATSSSSTPRAASTSTTTLMDELAAIRKATKPTNVLLVLDSMTGQDAVAVAEAFAERVDFDGVVLTKLDGDARGGAALSVQAVTGKPIKLVSTGEKLDQLEEFHPDRMASRILGMGDVLTLIERAEAAAERGRAGGDGEAHARRPVHVRRLPPGPADDAKMGPLSVGARHDSRARQADAGRERRRPRAGPRRGDRPLDDARRARPA